MCIFCCVFKANKHFRTARSDPRRLPELMEKKINGHWGRPPITTYKWTTLPVLLNIGWKTPGRRRGIFHQPSAFGSFIYSDSPTPGFFCLELYLAACIYGSFKVFDLLGTKSLICASQTPLIKNPNQNNIFFSDVPVFQWKYRIC